MKRKRGSNGNWLMLEPVAVSPRNYELPTDYTKKLHQQQDQQIRYAQWVDHQKGIH